MTATVYFLVWAALIFVMMRFGCGAHVMGHHHGHHGMITTPPKTTDPVCGMSVETASAKSTVYGGQAYYFCSNACRDKFEAGPQNYIGDSSASPKSMEAHHGTS